MFIVMQKASFNGGVPNIHMLDKFESKEEAESLIMELKLVNGDLDPRDSRTYYIREEAASA